MVGVEGEEREPVEGEGTSASRTHRILGSHTHLYKDKMNLDTNYLVVAE